MSTRWCLVPMYLIWILGCRLILSNNQSRATLWVLDTCLIVGLLPLIIIFLTASLSSKTDKIDETWSTLFRSRLTCLVGLWFFMWSVVLRDRFPCDSWPLDLLIRFGEVWNTSITKSQRSSAGIPSMRKPASRETSSASVELWLAPVFDLRKYIRVHLMLILSLQGLPQNQNLERILICIVVLCFPRSNIVWIHVCDECTRSNALNVRDCTSKFVHGSYIRSSNTSQEKTFQNNLWANCRQFYSLSWWSSKHGVATLCSGWVVLFASSQYFPTHFFAWPSMSQDHDETFASDFSETGSFFQSSGKNPGFEHISVLVYNIFACLTFSLSATQINLVKECCRFPQINVFLCVFHVGLMFCFFPASFMSSTYTDKNSPFSQLTNMHPQIGTFPIRVLKELSRIAFHMIVLPKDDRTDSAPEEQLDLPHRTIIWAICASVDVSKYQGHSEFGVFNNVDASSILTWV